MKENPAAFKHLINEEIVLHLSQAFKNSWADFDEAKFKKVRHKLKNLELKPRVHAIRDALHECLPNDYKKSVQILLKALHNTELSGFGLWPLTEFVQLYGLEDYDNSMKALYQLTSRFTSEFAIRPFILKYPQKTYQLLLHWSHDSNKHIRRLTSEGTRPRLPWGIKLQNAIQDPVPGIKILENLKYDDELYVRKSVANHLNDISKDHPTLVVRTLKRWKEHAPAVHVQKIKWIQRQALRSLIKQGFKPALHLMGFGKKAQLKLGILKLNKNVFRMKENLEFEIEILSTGPKSQKIAVDYIIHYQKANKKLSPKVFKWKVLELKKFQAVSIKKTHKLQAVTTRKHYPGLHRIEIQMNGQVVAAADWILKT